MHKWVRQCPSHLGVATEAKAVEIISKAKDLAGTVGRVADEERLLARGARVPVDPGTTLGGEVIAAILEAFDLEGDEIVLGLAGVGEGVADAVRVVIGSLVAAAARAIPSKARSEPSCSPWTVEQALDSTTKVASERTTRGRRHRHIDAI